MTLKAREHLSIIFEEEQAMASLESWLSEIEQRFAQQLLRSPPEDTLLRKHQYDAALQYRRFFLEFFDKTKR